MTITDPLSCPRCGRPHWTRGVCDECRVAARTLQVTTAPPVAPPRTTSTCARCGASMIAIPGKPDGWHGSGLCVACFMEPRSAPRATRGTPVLLPPSAPVYGAQTAQSRPSGTVDGRLAAMHQARAWLLGITAGLLIGVGFLLSWASGALTGNLNDPNAHANTAAGVIAGLLVLFGILMLPAVWRHYRSARNLRLGLR